MARNPARRPISPPKAAPSALEAGSVYHTFPPQRHAQIRGGKAADERRRRVPEPYMEAHQLFATLFGAVLGFNQHKRRAAPRIAASTCVEPDRQRARLAAHPDDGSRHRARQQRLRADRPDPRRASPALLKRARETHFFAARLNTGAIARNPSPAARQFRRRRQDTTAPSGPSAKRTRCVFWRRFAADDAAPFAARRSWPQLDRGQTLAEHFIARRHFASTTASGSGGASIQPAATRAFMIMRFGLLLA